MRTHTYLFAGGKSGEKRRVGKNRTGVSLVTAGSLRKYSGSLIRGAISQPGERRLFPKLCLTLGPWNDLSSPNSSLPSMRRSSSSDIPRSSHASGLWSRSHVSKSPRCQINNLSFIYVFMSFLSIEKQHNTRIEIEHLLKRRQYFFIL